LPKSDDRLIGHLYFKECSTSEQLDKLKKSSSAKSLAAAIGPAIDTAIALAKPRTLSPPPSSSFAALTTQVKELHVSASAEKNLAQLENASAESTKQWTHRAKSSCQQEVILDHSPVHLAAHRNYVYCMDDESSLLIFKMTTTGKFEKENVLKLSVPNVRGTALNANSYALTYAQLEKKHYKIDMLKKLKPSGVLLFKRDLSTVCTMYDRAFEVGSDWPQSFQTPIGVALDAANLYVCDSTLKCIFKFRIDNGVMLQCVSVPSGEPFKLSVNKNFLIMSDTRQHKLCLYELNTLRELKSVYINSDSSGPYGVCISDDNLIFVKNHAYGGLALLDVSLNLRGSFSKLDKVNVFSFAMLELSTNQTLVIGSQTVKGDKALLVYNKNSS
jgi:hypothetical protein